MSDPLQYAAAHSRWLSARLLARTGLREAEPFDKPFDAEAMAACLAVAQTHGQSLGVALRRLREAVMVRLIVRDLNGLADLPEVMQSMTQLAETVIRAGVEALHRELVEIHGEPLDAAGQPQRLMVVGMGKLGGGELNVSSDIDLIFVYPESGETAGPRRIENHEFFTRLGKRLIALLDDRTGDGFVFRVDMRLRPYGEGGPLVSSLAMLEDYFYTQAREWERYAWIKGRALCGDRVDDLESLRHPFVFRKYLDYGAFAAMRDLHGQIRREVARRDRADNIKVGPGGIREIEFIAQVHQLVRGGRNPRLQARPTQTVLRLLVDAGLLAEADADFLDRAYVFLRDLEHRIQYLDDAQTQELPRHAEDLQRVAVSMGFADAAGFMAVLEPLRAGVAERFAQVFGLDADVTKGPLEGLCELPEEDSQERLQVLGFAHPAEVLAQVCRFRNGPRYRSLPATSQAALDDVLPRVVEAAAVQSHREAVFQLLLNLIESISRRAPYLKMLGEHPVLLARIARLCGASPWAAQYLMRQPFLLDELLDERVLLQEPDWALAAAQLDAQMAAHGDDVERRMDALREFKQVSIFRLLAQDLEGKLTVERLSDHLSALADLLIAASLRLAWDNLPRRHREAPAFAVIAYGKLGGKELGYASDLDLVFLYDDDHPDAQDNYARLAKRLNAWMSTPTAAGFLYETDLRLRPDGASGLLVSTVAAFADYQSNHAWTWEHQALSRARFCVGDAAVGVQFESIRRGVLSLPRDAGSLRTEVLAMRQKMHDGHPNPSELFDLKHDAGGLVDCEFAVQFMVLCHAHAHPELLDNCGNIALLHRCAEAGLLPAEVALPAADAYRVLRRMQHQVKLQSRGELPVRVVPEQVSAEAAALQRLWTAVFAED